MCQFEYEDQFEYDRPRCHRCEETEMKFDRATEFLEAVLDELYGDKQLNHLNLERYLDELCHYMNVKIHPDELQIDRVKR